MHKTGALIREVSLHHFNRYRVKFRKVWSGSVDELFQFMGKVKKRKA